MRIETTPERSALMKRVRQRGTSAELVVRRLLTAVAARYRINVRGLPGTPDIANKARRKAVYVHGCFWHAHPGCARARVPKRNHAFWEDKLQKNVARDRAKRAALETAGFDVLIVWECELKNVDELRERLYAFWYDGSTEPL